MNTKPATLRDQMFSTSGGLVWHLTAWRRRADWADLNHQVAAWLQQWAPQRSHLVIVGASAGYTLPPRWLQPFAQRTVLEPDPLARALWRLRRPPARFDRLDALASGGFEALARSYPDAAVLFANVLGQVACPAAAGWRQTLATLPATMPWASFHEAFSTPLVAACRTPLVLPQPGDMETLVTHFWPGIREIEVIDHGALGLGGSGPHGYLPWSLRPGQEHLIEWCCRP